MKPSRSEYHRVRGLRYHCRIWGPEGAPQIFMLHGWMDVGASFQFVVDALAQHWQVIAPDWRGYGETDWGPADSYWFPDYLGDLDALLRHYSAEQPVALLGHSMGGNAACLYAGVRPQRVAKLINVEGFGMPATRPDGVLKRYARWLDELAAGPRFRPYASFDELAARLARENPRLRADRAAFLAQVWGQEFEGRVRLRGDPAHKLVTATQYQLEEAKVCWRAVRAPTVWIEGAETKTKAIMALTEADLVERRACFRDLRLEVVADAGHMIHHDQPDELARRIEGFLLG